MPGQTLCRPVVVLAIGASLLSACSGTSQSDIDKAKAAGASKEAARQKQKSLEDDQARIAAELKKLQQESAQAKSQAATPGPAVAPPGRHAGTTGAGTGRHPCGDNVSVTSNTSCAFAVNVKTAFFEAGPTPSTSTARRPAGTARCAVWRACRRYAVVATTASSTLADATLSTFRPETQVTRRRWCAVLGSILATGLLTGCPGTSPESAGTSESTTASARASKIKQMEQESLRLRKERGRLRAELSGKGAQTAQPGKSPSPHGSAASTGSPPALAGSAGPSRSFDALAGRMGGAEGLAFTRVGGTLATGLGSWRTGPRQVNGQGSGRRGGGRQGGGKPDAGAQPLIRRAITASDNAAAQQLWSFLGAPPTAASKVQAVLRSAGDGQTRVQSQRVRPGLSAFGQTWWPLAGQATFVATLPCLQFGRDVLTLMGEAEPGPLWGFGAAGRVAQFKGGWAPGPGRGTSFVRWASSLSRTARGSRWPWLRSRPMAASRPERPT